jgi:hypothetical protein
MWSDAGLVLHVDCVRRCHGVTWARAKHVSEHNISPPLYADVPTTPYAPHPKARTRAVGVRPACHAKLHPKDQVR